MSVEAPTSSAAIDLPNPPAAVQTETPSDICPKCGAVGYHTPSICRMTQRHRKQEEKSQAHKAEVKERTLARTEVREEAKAAQKENAGELIRKFLTDARDGALDEHGRNRLLQMVATVWETAKNPKSPQHIAAYEALMNRAYGRPKPSDEEIGALAKGGVQLVYVNQPKLELQEAKILPMPKPEFIEGEIVDAER